MKGYKKGFSRYIDSKRKARDNVGLLQNWVIDLVKKVKEKAKIFKASFTLVFTGKKTSTSPKLLWPVVDFREGGLPTVE